MTEKIKKMRNVALAGHGGAGKTSLAEAMLFKAGVITRFGKVEEGNTAMDFQPEEVRKQQSVSSAFHKYAWKKHQVTLMDTPGDQNFISSATTCIPAADSVIMVIDGVDGPSAMTEVVSDCVANYNLPSVLFINKLDRERSNVESIVAACEKSLKRKAIVVQLPIGSEADFKGVVDIVAGKAYVYDGDGNSEATDIPSDMADEVEAAKEAFVENIAELDDELLEKYLEGEEISEQELIDTFRKGILACEFSPVICGSATKLIGIDLLFDFINNALPSPLDRGAWTAKARNGEELQIMPESDGPFYGFVFNTIVDPYAGRLSVFRVISGTLGKEGNFLNVNKDAKERFTQLLEIVGKEQKPVTEALPGAIVAVAKLKETFTGDTMSDDKEVMFDAPAPMPPVISFAVSSKNQGEEDKVHGALRKIMEEDTGLHLKRELETNETILSGRGLVHIETTIEKIKRKFNVEMEINTPKVPYRETFKKKIRVQGRHKKQSGGHGQFGDCWIILEPGPKGSGFEFIDKIVGGSIPKTYIPAVEKGVVEASQKGILAGFPCVDFKVTVDDGSYHSVDSSEMAFKMAGSIAFKKAAEQASATLLEPIMKISIVIPDEYTGDIMGDLNSRRGRVLGMDTEGEKQVINAHVPMAEILRYAPDLRSMTGGRGTFTLEFDHYDEVPGDMAQKVIEKIKAEREE
ncbi:Translation elongation factor (GTPase) [Desulfamplus magnetovallimortis]|uniref:Elongation factor G n=1 Tax=Desulfamplus magnetovallimortis TaxID=1246637 RepID=L0R500_9BACT|nr:elongation factor G [Desulfamplus magnetovallimortis]CCO06632.1 Translation elongation factor (GTPase) [Desulfamplus magnetovallimortis BW-1]SLM32683.1 Translation elongation factor (GTPase) [Desulfamplus magnetovallimortis]